MTQTEYEQKRAECFEGFCKRYRIEEPSEENIESFNWVFDRAYALGKLQARGARVNELGDSAEHLAGGDKKTEGAI